MSTPNPVPTPVESDVAILKADVAKIKAGLATAKADLVKADSTATTWLASHAHVFVTGVLVLAVLYILHKIL